MANEKRLIDANELPLGKFVEPRTEWHQGWNDALDAAMLQAPTVDAVEVVRCKDCKHWKDEVSGCTDHVKCCEIGFYMVGENGYCAYGEKEE